MKATVIAIDFVKDTDGTFKALELNTNVLYHPMQQDAYINTSKITDFISANDITSFEYVGIPESEANDFYPMVKDLEAPEGADHTTHYGPRALESIAAVVSASIDYNENLVQYTSTTIPYLEDTPNTLIFRNAFDSTAIIDTTYAASSLAFLEFVTLNCSGEVEIPKTFIAPSGSDGQTYGEMIGLEPVIDTIDGAELRDNGAHPNYIIKLAESTISSDYSNYPKLLKITSAEHMQAIKESLTGDLILQEYILNTDDLIEGRAKTYRMTAAIAGGELEVIDFCDPYFVGNKLPLGTSPDFIEDETQKWERPAYVQKLNASTEVIGKFLNSTVFAQEGTSKAMGDIEVGDVIKSFNLTGLDLDEEGTMLQTWTGSYDGVFPGVIDTATVEEKTLSDTELFNLVYILKYDGGEVEATLESWINTIKDGEVKFSKVFELAPGDVLLGSTDNKVITEIKTKLTLESAGSIDIEEVDTAAVLGSDGTLFGMHNKAGLCNCYQCSGYAIGQNPCLQGPGCYQYPGCSSNTPYCSSYQATTYLGCQNGQK